MRYSLLLIVLYLSVNATEMKDLIWQDSSEVKIIHKDWQGAKDYCEELVFDGEKDWRLPTVKELQYIVDISVYKPAINEAFKNVKEEYYWSSTQDALNKDYAWSVDFRYGKTTHDIMLNEFYVRCVRG